ncbi:hypothetical protein JL722_14557 [Aureococcus anophagefferens]|nr:hypothetical protein JL722_14557 [Aureococcus anophagefferens]
MRVPARARDDRRGAAIRGRDALIVEYVRHLKSGDDEAKRGAAAALMRLADYDNYGIAAAVIAAGGVAPLVALLEDDDAEKWHLKWHLIYTLRFVASDGRGRRRRGGGVPRLVKLSQTLCTYGSAYAHTMWTLQHLADGDDAHWVAIAAAVSVEAQRARAGRRVRVGHLRRDALWNAGAAIRRAARALRSLFRACLGRAA